MHVSGIGGAGGGMGLGGPALLGGTSGTPSAGATGDALGANGNGAGIGEPSVPGMDTARFLFALMILAAMEKDKDGQGSGAAMGFLAGLMLAGAFRDMGDGGFQGATQGLAAGGLDLLA